MLMPIRLKKKASEGDTVELLDDLPKTEFKKGQRGTVVTAFLEPREAYDLEMVDESGKILGFAYSVRPEQFNNLSLDAFIRTMEYVERGDLVAAEKELKFAVDLRPATIGFFVNSIIASLGEENFKKGENIISLAIPLLRLALRVCPDYEVARTNLAIAFLKFGVRKGNEGHLEDAFELFHSALSIKTDERTESIIKNNLALVLTSFGEELFKQEKFGEGLNSFRSALLAVQNETTRRNLGLAYGIYAASLMESKRFDLAMQQFERAEDVGVLIPDFITSYGVCLAMLGQMALAKQAFERALELEPSNQEALHNMAFLGTSIASPRDLSKWLFTTGQSAFGQAYFWHGDFQTPVWQHDAVANQEIFAFT
jgi:Tfp pilus assembly protein PilF